LAAVFTQRVVRVIQPTTNEANFGVRGNGTTKCGGPGIKGITVEQCK
jgi:hypothetical protein